MCFVDKSFKLKLKKFLKKSLDGKEPVRGSLLFFSAKIDKRTVRKSRFDLIEGLI